MTYDDIIVGGGSAGAVLAARLAEDSSRKILLIEAGPDHPAPDDADQLTNPMTFARSLKAWGIKAHLTGDRFFHYAQGKVLGGGSGINGALAVRGEAEDYDLWAADGAPDWSWKTLLPYFRRLENDADFGGADHGTGGPLPVTRYGRDALLPLQRAFLAGANAHGFAWTDDHNAAGSTGIGPLPMNRRGGLRVSTALAYLAHRPANLTVLSDSLAVRTILEGTRTQGVEIIRDGKLERIWGNRVTLCAGALASPMLLQRSGIGPADALRKLDIPCAVDNRFVGENLMEHPGALIMVAPRDPGLCDPAEAAYQLGIRWTSSGGARNDMLIGLMNYWNTTFDPALRQAAGMDYVFAVTCGVHKPYSRGHVRLAGADPTVPPQVDFNMLSDPRDEARLLEGLRTLRDLLRTGPMQPVTGRMLMIDDADFADDAALGRYLRSVLSGWYHASGTCRMGIDPAAGAVVGQDLQVHGVEGLFVADASVMPSIPRAPTNLTVIAVAERAADILRSKATAR